MPPRSSRRRPAATTGPVDPGAAPTSSRRGALSLHGEAMPSALAKIALIPDDDGRDGVTVVVDGVPSSHLDPGDPTRLDFEYMRWMGDALDLLLAPGPLRAAHLGGAGCTLPRYVAATRPGSRQEVAEVDADVIAVARERLAAGRVPGTRLRHTDGRALMQRLAEKGPGSFDVVVRDAFVVADVPGHLCTVEFLDLVRTTLGPGGLYLANVADRAPLRRAREEAATARHVFGDVALVAEPAQFKGGHRHGNVVLLAGGPLRDTERLADLERRLAGGAVRARLMGPGAVLGFAAGARRLHDEPEIEPTPA